MEVTLIDKMGSDLTVVNSARVSFHKESAWLHNDKDFAPDVLSQADQKLINYLAKHNHWTPFSHVQITLREKVPIFVARQRFKHMVGFTYNEVSRRYVDDAPEFFIPVEWRGRPVNAKQGSSEEIITTIYDPVFDVDLSLDSVYKEYLRQVEELYSRLIETGVAPEQARMVLPQSMYTEYIVTGSLVAWARAYKLRSDAHSQLEIQELAAQWDKIISNIPDLQYSWLALKE